jgi:hypothetical protein
MQTVRREVFLSRPLAHQYSWIQILLSPRHSMAVSAIVDTMNVTSCISLLYSIHAPNNGDYIPKHYVRLLCTLNWFIYGLSVYETGLPVGLSGRGGKMWRSTPFILPILEPTTFSKNSDTSDGTAWRFVFKINHRIKKPAETNFNRFQTVSTWQMAVITVVYIFSTLTTRRKASLQHYVPR